MRATGERCAEVMGAKCAVADWGSVAFSLPKWLGAVHSCKRVHDAVQEGLSCALWPYSPVWLCAEHASKQVHNAGRVSRSALCCELAMRSACQQAGGGVQGEDPPVCTVACLGADLPAHLSWQCVRAGHARRTPACACMGCQFVE